MPDAGAPAPIAVVAAAIVRDGLVLAARRRVPELGWEFPGGKLDAGEDQPTALRRECLEELGAQVRPIRPIGASSNDQITITLWLAELIGGEPAAGSDHDALAWLRAEELDGSPVHGTAWLPLDIPLAAAARRELRTPA